jgi:hypothetical protein
LAKSAAALPDPSDTVSFSSLVAALEGGQLDRDLTSALRGVIARIGANHAKAGGRPSAKILLTIAFTFADGMVCTHPAFEVKPALDRPVDHFYPTAEHHLTQRSPFVQEALPIGKASR